MAVGKNIVLGILICVTFFQEEVAWSQESIDFNGFDLDTLSKTFYVLRERCNEEEAAIRALSGVTLIMQGLYKRGEWTEEEVVERSINIWSADGSNVSIANPSKEFCSRAKNVAGYFYENIDEELLLRTARVFSTYIPK